MRPSILLVNPYIYDFAAYDLWLKPLGLLYLASLLEENGCDVVLVDALDRWHPDVLQLAGRSAPHSKPFGDGHYYKEEVDKPRELAHVPRKYSRYGMPPILLRRQLENIQSSRTIDAVLVTSGMTYWYRGVHESIAICREIFPRSPILLGGIYATLFTDFARTTSGADMIIAGEGERQVLRWLKEKFQIEPKYAYTTDDDFPPPAYHLYGRLDYAAMLTSRGCPYTCSFCATHELSERFRRRDPYRVVEEMDRYAGRGIRNIAFYDDALFVNADRHIKVILRHVAAKPYSVNFHTPNGLFAKLVDMELAELMVAGGFKTIRLSYETKNPERQKQMRKVVDGDLVRALAHLERAGFPRHDVTVYLIMGLPFQKPSEVEESIRYVHDLGARVSLSSFTPIPGTREWDHAVEHFGFPQDEPLVTNKSIYPLRRQDFTISDFDRLKGMAVEGNRKLTSEAVSDYHVLA